MNGIVVVMVAAVVLAAGYLGYGRWLAAKWGVDRDALTPALTENTARRATKARTNTFFILILTLQVI